MKQSIIDFWESYKTINPTIGDTIEAWQFGCLPDELAHLVFKGKKTATTSVYDLYAVEKEPLPQVGSFDVILDSDNEPVCIIELMEVALIPFKEVSEEHAYYEGEGDRSLVYWRNVHWELFSQWCQEAGLSFSEDSLVVCERFRRVYPVKE